MKNKLTDNDPRLTAYALGELPKNEAEEITDVLGIGQNIALKKEVEKIDALSVMLSQTLGASATGSDGVMTEPQIKLSASQRDAIFRSAKAPTVDDVSSANQSRWLRPIIVTLGAAALVTLSFVALDNINGGSPSVAKLPDVSFPELSDDKLHAPILPSNKAWNASSSNKISSVDDLYGVNNSITSSGVSISGGKSEIEKLVKLEENDWVNRADSAVIRMPLICGKASWNWVSQSILQNDELPDKNIVRVEEIINAFKYEVVSDLGLKHASTGVDLVRCPWNKDNLIAVIAVENKYQGNVQIATAVSFSNAVNKYRLVGYARSENVDENLIAPEKITMAPGDSHIVLYEIEPEQGIENATDVLSLDINTAIEQLDRTLEHDAKTLDIQFSERDWTKASRDMQFALVMASWSQLISESNYDADMNIENFSKVLSEFEGEMSPSEEQLGAIEVLRKSLSLFE